MSGSRSGQISTLIEDAGASGIAHPSNREMDGKRISVDDKGISAIDIHLSANPQDCGLLTDIAMTYQDLVTRLRIPKRTLERLVSKGEIPHKRIGRQVRFYWPDVLDWLRNQKGTKRR